jgi:DNA-binding NtrC family response regulator
MNQRTIKILICGEDNRTADFLQSALKGDAYMFQHFEDIEKAIEHLSPGDYQVLLMGLCKQTQQGELDGLRAIPIVRKIDPGLPIIAIAHDESLEMERKARLAGIFYYLLQPLEVNEVRMSIMNAVQKYDKL